MSFNVEEKVETKSDGTFTLAKKGARPARLVGLIDCGVQLQEYNGEKKKDRQEFIPVFRLTKDTYENEDGDTVCINKSPFYGLKIFAGAKRGNYFDFCNGIDPECTVLNNGAGDLSKLLGRACLVNIEHTTKQKDGKEVTYANYAGCSPLPEDYPVDELPEGFEFITFDTSTPDKIAFDKLWDVYQTRIKEGVDYEGSELQTVLEGVADSPQDDNDQPY